MLPHHKKYPPELLRVGIIERNGVIYFVRFSIYKVILPLKHVFVTFLGKKFLL